MTNLENFDRAVCGILQSVQCRSIGSIKIDSVLGAMIAQIVRATFLLQVIQLNSLFAIDLPQCAEFRQRHSAIKECCEDVPFRRSLPMLFETYDSGNMTKIDNTLISLNIQAQQSAKFIYPFSMDVPYIDTVSICKYFQHQISQLYPG